MSSLRLLLAHLPRSLRRGGRRAAVAVVCIAVGVSAVVALQVASLSIGDVLTANVRAANGGDLALTSNSAPLSQTDLGRLRALQQRGAVTQWTAVSRIHVTNDRVGGRLIPFDANVVDTAVYPLGGQPTFVAPSGGSIAPLMQRRGDVIVSSVLANELGVGLRSNLRVAGVGGAGLDATVRGIVAQTDLEHSAVMLVRAQDRPLLTNARPQYVAVYANTTADPSTAATALRQSFPQATVQTVAEATASAQQQVHDFHTFSLLAGLVALLVAGVGIQNAMQSMLAARTTEVAMLEALGFPPLTVGALFTAEATALGLVGGAIGTAIGIGASSAVTSVISRVTAIQTTPHIDAGVAAEGLALGVGATVLFSLMPVVAAVSVRPLALLRGELPSVRRSAAWFSGLVIAIAALFALLASLVTGDVVVASLLVLGGLGGCLVLLALAAAAVHSLARVRRPMHRPVALGVAAAGVALVVLSLVGAPSLTPLLLVALAVWVGIALGPRATRLRLLMAGRNLDRRLLRTSVTLVALLSGALAGGLTITMAVGLRDQVAQALADTGTTNLAAIAPDPSRSQLLASANRLPGVTSMVTTVTATGRATAIDGTPAARHVAAGTPADEEAPPLRQLDGITGYDLAHGAGPTAFRVVEGRSLGAADAGGTNVLVDRALSDAPASIHPGSSVVLADAATGNQVTLHVVGLYQRSGVTSRLLRFSPRIEGDAAAARLLGGGDAQTVLNLTVAPTTLDADAVALQRATPGALVVNINDLTAVVRTTLNNILLVLTVVTAMVVLAGVAVVANSATLAMIERRREVAMMKAVGFGPGHVLGTVALEYALAGFIAASGAVLLIAGTLAVLSRAALQTPIGFRLDLSALTVTATVLLTAATAWVAAHGAARVRPLAALRNA